MHRFLTAAALIAVPAFALAHDYKIADLVIDHPVAKTTPARAMAGAGYVTITNNGDATDTLIAVEADFPRVEIHDTKVENDIATMYQVEGIAIAPDDTVTFAPGGKHIMFMGLDGDPFEAGETIEATLVFENAGRLDVTFEVETIEQIMEHLGHAAGDMQMDHSNHAGHGDHDDHKDHSDH